LTFKGWQKTSLIEYPGKIATVVFTGGCNFRCPFCYNAELVERPEKIADLPAETVLRHLRDNRALYQGLVVSGGEPTLHRDIPDFLAEVKALGFSTGLETNGTNPGMVAGLLEERLIDYVAMDVKAPLRFEPYRQAAGLKEGSRSCLEKVKETLEILKGARAQVELRCTVVPGVHTEEEIRELAGQLRGHEGLVLQQFVPERALEPGFRGREPFPAPVLRRLQAAAGSILPRCRLRGV
jgi:pyruvate formate lyase activating enzyme